MHLSGSAQRLTTDRAAFVATVLFAGATFWFAPRPPMIDLPQHAAQVALWHDLLLGTSKWQSLVYVNIFTPYLIGYSLALLLSFVMPVAAALKLLLAGAYFGFVGSCVALRKRMDGDPRLDWLFIPGFFGFAYAFGFYTFLIAAPFGVWFIVLAHRYADRPTIALALGLFVADLALFFTHGLMFLFANAIGGIFLLLRTRRLTGLLVAVLPYVAMGLWCLVYAQVRLRFEASPSGDPIDFVWGWDLRRLNFLVYSIDWPTGALAAAWELGKVLFFLLAAPVILGARPNRRDASVYVPFSVTLLIGVLVPIALLNTWLLYQRFALFLLPFYALIFRAPERAVPSAVRRLWLPLLCWTVLIVHTSRLLAFREESASFEQVLAAAEPGQRALGLVLDAASTATGTLDVYAHFPLWYQAEKGGFVDFNFAGYLPQVVRYKLDQAPPVYMSAGQPWQPFTKFDWGQDQAELYRYFFVRSPTPLPPDYFPAGRCAPVLLKVAGPWSLFENRNCFSGRPPATTPPPASAR